MFLVQFLPGDVAHDLGCLRLEHGVAVVVRVESELVGAGPLALDPLLERVGSLAECLAHRSREVREVVVGGLPDIFGSERVAIPLLAVCILEMGELGELGARELVRPVDDDFAPFRKDDDSLALGQVLEFTRIPDDRIVRDGAALKVATLGEGIELLVYRVMGQLERSGHCAGGEHRSALALAGLVKVCNRQFVLAVRRLGSRVGLLGLLVCRRGRRRRRCRTFVSHCRAYQRRE